MKTTIMQASIQFQPNDVLFFRDGTPLNHDEANQVTSLRIPYPSVFYGAIVSMMLRKGWIKTNNAKFNLDAWLKEHLKIKQIYLCHRHRVFLPLPLDVFLGEYRVYYGKYDDSLLYPPETQLGEKVQQAEDYYIYDEILFNKYTRKKTLETYECRNLNEFFASYHKVGLARDTEKRIALENHLYSYDMIEPAPEVSFVVDIEMTVDNGSNKILDNQQVDFNVKFSHQNFKLSSGDQLLLGGLMRKAYVSHCSSKKYYPTYQEKEQADNRIKLIFTTPAIIHPVADQQSIKESSIEHILANREIKIITKVIGKPLYIGGFDMVKKQQKPIQLAIPAGSIFVLESEWFVNKKISDIHEMFDQAFSTLTNRAQGYACFIITKGDHNDE